MKNRFLKVFLYPFIILFSLISVMTFSSLLFGVSNSDSTIESLALSFDKYLKTSEVDYVAVEFSSTNPVNPIRRSELNQVSTFQNLWQLSKGPDNSLIRIYSPAYLDRTKSVVAPLTIYPAKPVDDDSGAITPTVYTGYDQDFRGDYLDIQIKQLKNQDNQINWSDFYSGGAMENYKSDTHSIMVSETLARKIYAARENVPIENVTDENIEELVGERIRSKMMNESGVVEPKEREPDRDEDLRDDDVMESEYYSPKFSRVKKIIGILDNKSAEKYKPLIGEDFVFAVPTPFVSYDYFHPVVYGMFNNNLVGNRTSLRYFMAFEEVAKKDKEYNLCFCDTVSKDGELQIVRDGYLQTNYLKARDFYQTNKHFVCSFVSVAISILSSIGIIGYLVFLFVRHKEELKQYSTIFLLAMLTSFIVLLLVFYLVKTFSFIGFNLPTMSIGGFIYLLIVESLITIFYLFVSKKHANPVEANDSYAVKTNLPKAGNKVIYISKSIVGLIFGFTIFVLLNVAFSSRSLTSVGLPSLAPLIGCAIAVLMDAFKKTKNTRLISKTKMITYLKEESFSILGSLFGVILAATLSQFGFIWVPGIGFTITKVLLAFALSVIPLLGAYWFVLLLRIIERKSRRIQSSEKEIKI